MALFPTYPDLISAVDVARTSYRIGYNIGGAIGTLVSNIRDLKSTDLSEVVRYGTNTNKSHYGVDEPTQAYYLQGPYRPRDDFPIGGPLYTSIDQTNIYPWMHSMGSGQTDEFSAKYNGGMLFAVDREMHVTSNSSLDPIYTPEILKQISAGNSSIIYPIENKVPGVDSPFAKWNMPFRQSNVFQYQGSVTPVNPEGDPEKNYVLTNGLENSDKRNASFTASSSDEANASPGTPTSPIHPFTRSYSERSRNALVTAYNRTKLPIADAEHRKGFRYIFITRPECYLLASDGVGGTRMSVQCQQDEDMNTCGCRMPHILRALSPVYVCPAPGNPHYANWNYLLCNRIMSMGTQGQSLSILDSVTKGIHGATVTPGKIMTSNLGGTLDISFRDTKWMDVYEMLRIHMLYIHKRKIGKFSPPFNGYTYANEGFATGFVRQFMHPYDRALEYCVSIWDIITNETGTKILYWCKYYGAYPTACSTSVLSNDNASAITGEARVSSTWQYQYKQENVYQNLIEFNYNAGIFDNMGVLRSDVDLRNAVPFLYREDGNGGASDTSSILKNYVGAASMFTGSPFIISEVNGAHDPWKWDQTGLVQNNLCFMPVHNVDSAISTRMNLGITNEMPVK